MNDTSNKKVVELIANKMIYVRNNARKSNLIDDSIRNRVYVTQDGGFSINNEGAECLDSIIKIIRENIDLYDEKFSDRYVEDLIKKAL